MRMINGKQLALLREIYPKGTRVRLLQMNDPYTKLEQGDIGTVISVDDIGTIHVAWDKGGSLGVAFGEDYARKYRRKIHTFLLKRLCSLCSELTGYIPFMTVICDYRKEIHYRLKGAKHNVYYKLWN